jgi:hypothetical protein
MSSESYEFDDDQPTKRWKLPLSWPTILIGAWILYEVTTQPAIAIVTVCLKFGWNDFRTAIWSWRRDLDRHRAWACFWLYLAAGAWKTAIAAIGPMFLIPILLALQAGAQQQPRPPVDPPDQFMAVVLTLFFGFLFSALTTLVGTGIALHRRVRIWLSSAIHRDRIEDVWPPLFVFSSGVNHLNRLLTAALLTLTFPVSIAFTVWLGIAIEKQDGPPAAQREPDMSLIAFLGVLLGSLIGLPVIILVAKEWILKRVAAQTPLECWPDSAIEEKDLA